VNRNLRHSPSGDESGRVGLSKITVKVAFLDLKVKNGLMVADKFDPRLIKDGAEHHILLESELGTLLAPNVVFCKGEIISHAFEWLQVLASMSSTFDGIFP